MANIEHKLNDDIVGMIKSFLYVKTEPTLTIDEIQFIIYINKLKPKDLKVICKENKIRQSTCGVSNSKVLRLNIMEWKLKLSKNIFEREHHHPLRKYIRFNGVQEFCMFTNEKY